MSITDILWTPEPWLPYLVTEFIRQIICPVSVFEWGSGGSTVMFLRMKLARLVSVEHDPAWYERIQGELSRRSLKHPDYRLIPYEDGEIAPDKGNPAHYKSGSTELGPVNFRAYASAIDDQPPFDLVLVDGMARASCLAHAVGKVKPGGYLVLDNTGDRPYYLEQTRHLFEGWETVVIDGHGPILDYPWQTTILRNVPWRT